MGKKKAPQTPKRRRKNWSRGSPKKQMDKAIRKYEVGKLKLEAQQMEQKWDKKQMRKELSKLVNKIVKDSPLKGSGKTVLRERVGLNKSRSNQVTPFSQGRPGQGLTMEQELDLVKWVADKELLYLPVSKSEFKAEALLVIFPPSIKSDTLDLKRA